MKTLIKHLVENNFDEILNKSLLHCHVKGLHSIMLLESPGKTIRLYVAGTGHDLEKNSPGNFNNGVSLSLSFHPHHCNLTLHAVKGNLLNWEVKEVDAGGFFLNKWQYNSGINQGQTSFLKLGSSQLRTIKHRYMVAGDTVMMKADQIHTVSVRENEIAAWLVYEGKENPDYIPYAWSNTDLNKQDFSDLYQKPTAVDIQNLLNLTGLLT